jgi:hypothetical protein
MLLPTVSRSVCLGVNPDPGPETRFALLSDSYGFLGVGHPSDERTGLSFVAGRRQHK